MSELKQLQKCALFTTIDIKENDTPKYLWLDYHLLEDKKDNLVGLKVNTDIIKLDTISVDGEFNFLNYIIGKSLDYIIENASDAGLPTIQPLEDGTLITERRLIARILGLCNMIASEHRRGPAQYVILSKSNYDYLNDYFNDPILGGSELLYISGMIIYHSIKVDNDTIIVGRSGREDDPGLKLFTSDYFLGGYELLNSDLIKSITNLDANRNIKYRLQSFGKLPIFKHKFK